MRNLLKLSLPLLMVLFSCENEEFIDSDSINVEASRQPDRITICHYEAVTDTWKQMTVHPNALDSHLAHGDMYGEFCPDFRLDEDNDGVTNDLELCPETPEGETVDENGCAESQLDDDGDGVTNDMDLCPNTIQGEEVDENGCSISLYTSIPDPNFEQALIDLGMDSENILDGRILTSDISAVILLNVNNKNISDLTGIEDFAALQYLFCHSNQLTSLDLSYNVGLEHLYCYSNQLNSLNISQNTELIILDCHSNRLSSLDVSNNAELRGLYCTFNQLSNLDVSQNIALQRLDCYYNQLTSLDLSQNIELNSLSCENNQLSSLDVRNGNNTNFTSFKTYINPNLECIEVDDAAYSTANWVQIDANSSFSEDCGY